MADEQKTRITIGEGIAYTVVGEPGKVLAVLRDKEAAHFPLDGEDGVLLVFPRACSHIVVQPDDGGVEAY